MESAWALPEGVFWVHSCPDIRKGDVPSVPTHDLSSSHLTEDEVVAYLGHRLAGEPLRRVELHLARCADCRQEVIEATEIMRSARRVRWPVMVPAAAAAAVALLFLGWPQNGGTPTRPAQHRESPLVVTTVPAPVAPLGVVADVEQLVWSRVASADRYRLTLYDEAGSVLWRETTTDSLLSLPDSVPIEAGRVYLWKVEARVGWDVWESSELTEFRVR